MTVIFGTTGNDSLTGTEQNDSIFGLANNDNLSGLGGNDALFGGTGDDSLDGGFGNDLLYGDDGNDSLGDFSGGDDILFGGAGNDNLSDSSGSNRLYGDDGNDSLQSFNGNDTLVGGSGDDILDGTFGNTRGKPEIDVLTGEAGKDTFVFKDGLVRAFIGPSYIGAGNKSSNKSIRLLTNGLRVLKKFLRINLVLPAVLWGLTNTRCWYLLRLHQQPCHRSS